MPHCVGGIFTGTCFELNYMLKEVHWYRLALPVILFLGRCHRAAERHADTILRESALTAFAVLCFPRFSAPLKLPAEIFLIGVPCAYATPVQMCTPMEPSVFRLLLYLSVSWELGTAL